MKICYNMDKELNSGLMVPYMLVNGKMEKLQETVSLLMLIKIFIKENLIMIWQTAMESIRL